MKTIINLRKVSALVVALVLIAQPTVGLFGVNTASAVSVVFSDSFGTGSTDTTFNESPSWSEGGDGAEKRAAGSGNDSASPNGGRFATIFGKDGWICTTVDATDYEALSMTYHWRGDADAEGSDNGILEYKEGTGNCNTGGWTVLKSHNLSVDGSWSLQGSFNLPSSLEDSKFRIRYRVDSSATNEHFRVDGVVISGDEIVKINICHATGSQNNPWNALQINQNAWSAHEAHDDYLYEGPLKNGKPDNKHNNDDEWCENNVPEPTPPVENTCFIPLTNGEENRVIGDSPEEELTLQEILDNAFGLNAPDAQDDQIDTEIWAMDLSAESVTFDVTILGKEAGNTQNFGYYKAGDNSSFVSVFTIPSSVVGDTFSVTIPSSFATSIGFAIDTSPTDAGKRFTEVSLNSDSADHSLVFNPLSNVFALAFEDLLSGSWDQDYNDLVVKISNPVCEFCDPTDGAIWSDQATEVNEGNASLLTFIHPAWTADVDGAGNDAKWIWSSDPVSEPTTSDDTQTFTRDFTIVGNPEGADLYIATDNFYKVWINGNFIGQELADENNFQVATQDHFVISPDDLVNGVNELKVEVTNKGVGGSDAQSNPAGLMFYLSWTAKDCGDDPTPPQPPPQEGEEYFDVTFHKYIDGVHANEQEASFSGNYGYNGDPDNLFTLNSGNAFDHQSVPILEEYSVTWSELVEEDVISSVEDCEVGKYYLLGYTFSNSEESASGMEPSLQASFPGIADDMHVIFWNVSCPIPQEQPPVDVCENIEGTQTEVPEGYTLGEGGECIAPNNENGDDPPQQSFPTGGSSGDRVRGASSFIPPSPQVLGEAIELPGLPNTGNGPISNSSNPVATIAMIIGGLMALAVLNISAIKMSKVSN